MSKPESAITAELIERFRSDLDFNQHYRTVQNAVTQITVDDIALNRRVITETDHTFSHLLDDWTVTNQKSSGRCWSFAGLNLFRVPVMKRMNLKDFEFSQNFVLFWDKLERCNYFLEAIIETADRDVDERTVAYLLDRPIVDGGQWTMFVNIIKKYGLVPQAFMPESESSSNTRRMNFILSSKLREAAKTIRDMAAKGRSRRALLEYKNEILNVIYRILSIHLGEPPAKFIWQWHDKDRKFHREEEMTPGQFYNSFIEVSPDEYVCLVNDARSSRPYGKTYTVEYLGNVIEGDAVLYLNVKIERMKKLAVQIIQQGEPVWFGCDMSKMMHRKLGIMDGDIYEYDRVYGSSFEMDKGSRLEYHQARMSHAMLFTGVDLIDGRPRRWRVENSWGDEYGKKGFFVMNDSWFDENMFEIAVKKSCLSSGELKALEEKPTVLPPWDPMGALAL
jgi:bleomycin hydrolase